HVFQFVNCDVQTPKRSEVLQKIQIPAGAAVHIKLDIGPIRHQARHLLQLSRRQGLIELDDFAIGFERAEWVAKVLDDVRTVRDESTPEFHSRSRHCRFGSGFPGKYAVRVLNAQVRLAGQSRLPSPRTRASHCSRDSTYSPPVAILGISNG